MRKHRRKRVYMSTAQTGLFWSVWVNSVLSRAKTVRAALFFTWYDEFDVLGWFPRENIQECVRLHAKGSNRAASERLG